MESGEKELRKVFEETTVNNVRAGVEHSNVTRQLVRQLEKKVDLLEGNIRTFTERMDAMQQQITNLQSKLYKGGGD